LWWRWIGGSRGRRGRLGEGRRKRREEKKIRGEKRVRKKGGLSKLKLQQSRKETGNKSKNKGEKKIFVRKTKVKNRSIYINIYIHI
jgi:hypothetical protein